MNSLFPGQKNINSKNVSAVVCTYNEEKCIRLCLKTLLESDSRIDDVIVVDDNSSDKTKEIVMELHDPRIRFFSKPKKYLRGKNDSTYLGALMAYHDDLIMLDADH